MNQNKNIFCTNCGKTGHHFRSCKKPITSSGIICFRKNNNIIEYLLICRRNTLGFVEFMRGKYPMYFKSYIANLIDEMTMQEKNNILSKDFDDLWYELWGDFNNTKYSTEGKISKSKFNNIKDGVNIYKSDYYKLRELIEKSQTTWTEPEWGFPKGRREYNETDVECSKREFQEETGIYLNKINMISNIIPYEETFMGSNYKTYKHKYYLAYMKEINHCNNFQKTEVSNMKWLSYNDAIKHIRPYNYELRDILKKVNRLVQTYSFI
tara:strand:- start:346 stop:1143 length:798 start_codon:yes stop_codon:yes gene_type:complete